MQDISGLIIYFESKKSYFYFICPFITKIRYLESLGSMISLKINLIYFVLREV